MDSVLIFTDNTRIEREKDFLDDSVAIFQSVYNALVAVGVTPTLDEINNLVSWTRNGNGGPNFEQEFVINKLLDAATYIVNSITVTRDGMRNIMAIPDVSGLIAALKGVGGLYSNNPESKGVRVNLLSLTAGVVAKALTAYASITTEFTYYTKSDASAALANSLQSICDTLNTHDDTYQNVIAGGIAEGRVNTNQMYTPMKGLAIVDGDTFVPSLSFIRKFEQTGSLFS